MKNYENDVYVIGGKKRVAWLRYAIIVLCIAAGVISHEIVRRRAVRLHRS